MNTEQDLRILLLDKADRVYADPKRRDRTLRIARKSRRTITGLATLALASVAVIGVAMTGSLRQETPPPVRVDRPAEHYDEDDDQAPVTDVLVAEARDGSWRLYGGVSEDGKTLCLSLGGIGCTITGLDRGFVLLQSFGSPEEQGFIYGPVAADVVTLELGTDGQLVPLRLREFPNKLGLGGLRYFVHPIEGQGAGTVLAKDGEGFLIQRIDLRWGDGAPSQRRQVRAMVEAFMERRTLGSGAEGFLDEDGLTAFSLGGAVAPLYPVFDIKDFDIVFIDEVSGTSYEVGVRLIFSRGSIGHTYFVRYLGERFVISGGRRGLEGP